MRRLLSPLFCSAWLWLGLLLWLWGCQRPFSPESAWLAPAGTPNPAVSAEQGDFAMQPFPTGRPRGAALLTPTPDLPRQLPTLRSQEVQHVVQPNDTLGQLARRYNVSVLQITLANRLENPDLLSVGQNLIIPAPTPLGIGPAFKIIPDSELVYGPASIFFDLEAFIKEKKGFLLSYQEEVDQRPLSGIQIVQRIAQEYSVSPRLLLALLERQGGWVTQANPSAFSRQYPLGVPNLYSKSLYRQLAWAANELNRGYYLWRVNGVAAWVLADGSVIPPDTTINAGTAAVQQLFAQFSDRLAWQQAVGEEGLFAVFFDLFGYPFDYAIEPLLPSGLSQPALQLPFEPGIPWAFTGGPHAGYGDGAAWAALDFAPAGAGVGCYQSEDWVTAAADGLIVYADHGLVILDLDGDGWQQTGWVLVYLHIEERDRVAVGSAVKAGQRLGHPSCEGGLASGTHVHLARKYNGEWIPADQNLPFILDGWVSSGSGKEYDGYLQRSNQRLEAYAGSRPENQIMR